MDKPKEIKSSINLRENNKKKLLIISALTGRTMSSIVNELIETENTIDKYYNECESKLKK